MKEMIWSTTPPTKPATRPMKMPKVAAKNVAVPAMISEVRQP